MAVWFGRTSEGQPCVYSGDAFVDYYCKFHVCLRCSIRSSFPNPYSMDYMKLSFTGAVPGMLAAQSWNITPPLVFTGLFGCCLCDWMKMCPYPRGPWRWRRRRWLGCQTGGWLGLYHTLSPASSSCRRGRTADTWWCCSWDHKSPYWQNRDGGKRWIIQMDRWWRTDGAENQATWQKLKISSNNLMWRTRFKQV